MYSGLQHAHSGLRWLTLGLLLWVIFLAASGLRKSDGENTGLRRPSLLAMIMAHLQAVLGLSLLMVSQKVMFTAEMMSSPLHRFFTMEHSLMMLTAVIFITIGHGKAKAGKAKSTLWFYLSALLLILAAIPWPFRTELGGHWF